MKSEKNKKGFWAAALMFFLFLAGLVSGPLIYNKFFSSATANDLSLDEQEATVRVIKQTMPAVVSVIVYDRERVVNINQETGQETYEMKLMRKGAGTGFIISKDGLILTNKHVVNSSKQRVAVIKVIMNDGKEYDANLIDKDPLHDLAVLKIGGDNLPFLELANSDNINIGQSVIAIGNVLGIYQNSATKGIVSGLGRRLSAVAINYQQENFENLIQVDADINPGNSGGPLINLEGKVVGVNVAVDKGGSGIGFAIPANDVRPAIQSVKEKDEIIRPKIGIRYLTITPDLAAEEELSLKYGAWVKSGIQGQDAVLPDSPAQEAGIEEGDIIFEINAIELKGSKSLFSIMQNYKPGDKIGLKIKRGDKVLIKIITLGEFR